MPDSEELDELKETPGDPAEPATTKASPFSQKSKSPEDLLAEAKILSNLSISSQEVTSCELIDKLDNILASAKRSSGDFDFCEKGDAFVVAGSAGSPGVSFSSSSSSESGINFIVNCLPPRSQVHLTKWGQLSVYLPLLLEKHFRDRLF